MEGSKQYKGKYTWWDFRWMESQTHQYINRMLVPIVYYSFKGFSIKYILFICWFGIIFEPHVFLTTPWQTMKYSWRQVIPKLVVSCACHHNIAVLIDSWRIVSCRMQKSRAGPHWATASTQSRNRRQQILLIQKNISYIWDLKRNRGWRELEITRKMKVVPRSGRISNLKLVRASIIAAYHNVMT